MKKRMLIDATQSEETRVVMLSGDRIEDFDLESISKMQLKGNVYLAKVTRVEPSLQAAFVNYGGNRHGFLPFAEIHPDYYRIPVADRERLLAEQEDLRRQIRERRAAEEAADEAEAEAAERAEREGIPYVPEQAPQENGFVEMVDYADKSDEIITLNDAAPAPVMADEPQSESAPFAELLPPEPLMASDATDTGFETEEEFDADFIEDAELMPIEGEAAEGGEGETAQADGENDGRRGGRRGRFRGRGGKFRRRGGRREAALDNKLDELVDKSASEGDDDDFDMQPLWKRIRRAYKIQEVIKRGQIMLIQVVKEERGNKGAAVTTYITMPGRYCVLMPNSPDSGGVSRKIANVRDRRRMRKLLTDLAVPDGMSVILRTAGVERETDDIKHDLTYLMKQWDQVRDTTLQSSAPALIHAEGSLIKRAVRDHFSTDVSEVLVSGDDAFKTARDLMSLTMPDCVDRVKQYAEPVPLFVRYGVENQLDAIHSNTVQLKSGGYLVINPTEALVSIDVNSGRATRERHIEETALRTNLEAAEEVARQLRLRDLGGLVVIDFIDMENRRNNAQVERRLRDALSNDRARIQMGRISNFGLLELSRQRLRPSLTETHFHTCPHCRGTGLVRTVEAQALNVLRAIEKAGIDGRAGEITVTAPTDVLLFILNQKRDNVESLSERYDLAIQFAAGELPENESGYDLDISKSRRAERVAVAGAIVDPDLEESDDESSDAPNASDGDENGEGRGNRRRGRRGGRGRNRNRREEGDSANDTAPDMEPSTDGDAPSADAPESNGDETAAGTDEEGARSDRRRSGRNRRERGNRRERNGTADAVTAANDLPSAATLPQAVQIQVIPVTGGSGEAAVVDRSPRSSVAYEVQTEAAEGEKKQGWWKRLIK